MEHIAEEYEQKNIFFKQYICKENTSDEYFSNKVSDNIFLNINKYLHEEYKYLNIVQNVIENGNWEDSRNGRTKSVFGVNMTFSLKNNTIPILTTKKTAWKTCLKELLWFISGKTNNNILKNQGVHIWDDNASTEFLNKYGIYNYKDGELGPIYGHQWRHFNAKWNGDIDYTGQGIDQLQYIIDQLKNPETRNSRRLVMTAWNPCQLNQMALPPCHLLCQFYVHNGNKLSCALYQRSADLCLGVPFNIASYSFLTHLIAKHCGLEAYEFKHFLGNCHIYEEHIEPFKTQLQREPYTFPTVSIKQVRENINLYNVDDFEINNYISHDPIKFKMFC